MQKKIESLLRKKLARQSTSFAFNKNIYLQGYGFNIKSNLTTSDYNFYE